MSYTLPTNAQDRKDTPIVTGVLDYFPRAIAEVARVSKAGNDQHNPGQPLHWARGKSTDHADCIGRHLLERGTLDTDGKRHSAKAAWRALALLETELELAEGIDAVAGAAKAERALEELVAALTHFIPCCSQADGDGGDQLLLDLAGLPGATRVTRF